ncbi:unnamed protein product [Nippostrongylus brasiliensis]|uniref:Secreted protein n=1 Tax=Nippostrongylus brasiliensis TaxID=27835 RepID=A0A0N4YHM1_NIPBR|nr:unnamed protein product [Nippostrongylus brasiliensis]
MLTYALICSTRRFFLLCATQMRRDVILHKRGSLCKSHKALERCPPKFTWLYHTEPDFAAATDVSSERNGVAAARLQAASVKTTCRIVCSSNVRETRTMLRLCCIPERMILAVVTVDSD